jgi:acid phosphatase type 7
MSSDVSKTGTSVPLFPACIEHGVWVPIPVDPPGGSHRLTLKEIDPDESHIVKQRGVLTFHAVGCSGDFKDHLPGKHVAKAMAAQIHHPQANGGGSSAVGASFLFHLGDIVYKDEDPSDPLGNDQATMYNSQFYTQFTGYDRPILAIAGNHDGKSSEHRKRSAISHFLQNFCSSKRQPRSDSQTDQRLTMTQPYPYWLFETSVACIVGLYTNDINGGQLDDPMRTDNPQYRWLVDTLKGLKDNGKVVFLALHHPPYSGAANFAERGDPNLGPTPRRPPPAGVLQPLGIILQQAFHESGHYPDVVISAHAHLYQRITYTYANGWQIPYLIAGSGGHAPVEELAKTCSGETVAVQNPPFDVVLPPGSALPKGDSTQVIAYNDKEFGFLRFTVDLNNRTVTGEFFTAYDQSNPGAALPALSDTFTLRLANHRID